MEEDTVTPLLETGGNIPPLDPEIIPPLEDIITSPLEAGQNPLTIFGGWCAPPSPLYDPFPAIETEIFKYDMPSVQVQRGGITYNIKETWLPPKLTKDERFLPPKLTKDERFLPPKLTKDERFLTMALGVALTSKCRFKHGAIVVKHSKILGASPNINKNDPKTVDYQHCSVHAEMAAMRRAGWPKKAYLYVARVNRNGETRLSKPCATCQVVLDEYKIKVFWTESK